MKNTFLPCEICGERSKYPSGFWDGEDGSGCTWDCNNFNCDIKQERDRKAVRETVQQVEAHQENHQSGVNVARLKWMRRKAHCSAEDISYAFGISPAKYVAYEIEQETMPFYLYELAIAYLIGNKN